MPISVFIIAKNEADRIGRTLEAAAKISDDLIVIDSGSSDNTVKVAQQHGARTIYNEWPGYGPQKRFGEEQCSHDWVLNLDADEVLSEELIAQISALFEKGEPSYAGYTLNVVTIYPGHQRPRPLADYYKINRLYNRRKMRFSPSLTDDRVVENGQPVGSLTGLVWHYSFRKIEDIAPKMENYARQQVAEKASKRTTTSLRLRLLIEYPVNLLRYLFGRRHITGGLLGLRYAHEVAKSKK